MDGSRGNLSRNPEKELSLPLAAILLAAIIILGVLLRLPTLGDLSCDPDVAGIRYTGEGITKGFLPYRESVESKPPGAYFLAAASLSLFGQSFVSIYLFAILWILLTALALFAATRELSGDRAGVLASLFFVLFSTTGYVDGLCPNYETWASLPLVMGLLYGIKSIDKSSAFLAGIAGLMASFAIQIKLQALFPAIALGLFTLAPLARPNKANLIRTAAFIAGGFAAALPLILYYSANGALTDLISHFLPSRPMDYATENSLVLMAGFLPGVVWGFIKSTSFLVITFALGLCLLFRFRSSGKNDVRIDKVRLYLFWLAGCAFAVFFLKGLFSAALFARHYFVLMIPALCIAGGVGLSWLLKNRFFKYQFPVAAIASAIWIGLTFSSSAAISAGALAEFAELKTTDKAFVKSVDYTWLDQSALRPVGYYIRESTLPGDTIYVWDYVPSIYSHARRRAPSRHYKHWEVVTTDPWGHYFDDNNPAVVKAREELMSALNSIPPKYIVAFKYYGDHEQRVQTIKNDFFPELQYFVDENYEMVTGLPPDWDALLLYRLRNGG